MHLAYILALFGPGKKRYLPREKYFAVSNKMLTITLWNIALDKTAVFAIKPHLGQMSPGREHNACPDGSPYGYFGPDNSTIRSSMPKCAGKLPGWA